MGQMAMMDVATPREDLKVEVSGILVVKGVGSMNDAVDRIVAALGDAGITMLPEKKFGFVCHGH